MTESTRAELRLFSYVVEHDRGHAPNPYFGFCTLNRCKFRKHANRPKNLVETAEPGDWIVGTGGANLKRSAGNGKIVYVMRVDKKMSRLAYYRTHAFAKKKRDKQSNDYRRRVGDNVPPITHFEKDGQFVLISWQYWYFGRDAISIPKAKFRNLEKKGPGFRYDFDDKYFARFRSWMLKKKTGRHGEPCLQQREEAAWKEAKTICKSSC